MKNAVDVMSIQQRDFASRNQKALITDYRREIIKGLAPRFLFECSIKLNMKPPTSATAAVIFHRFCKEISTSGYDDFIIVPSCLYLAGKILDDPVKIRDVINVTYNTINRGLSPLELGEEYWTIRDSIIQAELLIARVLKFNFNIVTPHIYILHYLKALKDWFGSNIWNSVPIAKTAMSFLQDFYHSPVALNYKPSHIAVCCIALSLQTYGVQIPIADEYEEWTWYQAFVNDLSKEKLWEIIECIIDVYNCETKIDRV